MSNLPSGTVTFLFTDIEGSTQLWEQHPEAMKAALAKHDSILRDAVESQHGQVIKTTGDGVHAVFTTALEGLHAALTVQREFQTGEFFRTSPISLRVRIGLHTGEAELRAGDYYGSSLNRAARIMSIGHGGQILLSATTAQVAREQLSNASSLLDLGEHYLKGFARPEKICQLIVPDLEKSFPPLNSISTATNNLPTQLTSFIGREKEIAEIQTLLNTARLVTLTGSGGTGKTRLSIEVGTQELTSFSNGVWMIELAPLSDPAQIIPALAQAFGLQELPFRPLASLVVDYLRDKKLLLLLDNCEHLIAACARLADDLLHQCAALKILASSREALGIAGEVAYRTPSLAESESTRLFVERAHAVNSKFDLTDSNASPIAQICSRLDGIPLAIELAAARTKLFSVDQISARLDDLFRLLVGGSRTALPRQQTLRALIDWSYDLLSDEEQQLLRTASVFVGGWTLDALDAVSSDPNAIEYLEGLVNKSLVVAEERGNEMRYFMLETIRQYAREKLFEARQSSAARDRHFVYFDDLSEKIWQALRSSDLLAWRNRADDEAENLRAALEWGLENYVEKALHLAASFCVISSWFSKQADGLAFVKTAIERVKSLPPVDDNASSDRQKLLAQALFVQGMVGMGQGNIPQVIQALQEAISISRSTGDKLLLGHSLGMFFVASTLINAPGAAEAAQEALIIFTQEITDTWGLGMAYQGMARIASNRGDLSEKQLYFGKLKELTRARPLSFQTGMFFLGMGMDERVHGNYEVAKQIFQDALNIFRRLRHRNFQTVLTSELGHIARYTGAITHARTLYQETIKSWQDLGNRPAIAHQLECFGFLAITTEEPQRAAKLFGAAEALRARLDNRMTESERVEYDRSVAQLRDMLPEAKFNALWAEGRSMTMEQAIQLALAEPE